MRTQLANPTKYHVIQKQKNQVKQYLSESFKSSESLHNLILPYPVLEHNNSMAAIASKSQPATSCNSPIVRANVNSKLLNHVTMKNSNLLSQSANEMIHVQSLEYSSGQSASNSSFPFVFQHRYVATASPHSEVASSAMSPTISSVATSVTSASEVRKQRNTLKKK